MILTLDPGINETGWCIGDFKGTVVASGVIRTKTVEGHAGSRHADLADKLAKIYMDHSEIAVTVLEVPGGFTYNRSAGDGGKSLNAASMGILNQAIGVIYATIFKARCPMTEVQASTWKGRKMDKQTVKMLSGKSNHNEADAVELYKWARVMRPWGG